MTPCALSSINHGATHFTLLFDLVAYLFETEKFLSGILTFHITKHVSLPCIVIKQVGDDAMVHFSLGERSDYVTLTIRLIMNNSKRLSIESSTVTRGNPRKF